MDNGRFFIGEEKTEEELGKEYVDFGEAKEVGKRKVYGVKNRKIYKMLSNIVVVREKNKDLSNTYNVYSFKPTGEDYKKLIDYFREKINRGELTGRLIAPYIYDVVGEDKVKWYGDLDREKVELLISAGDDNYFFCVGEDKNILFGDAEDLPFGKRETILHKPIYWKKLNKSLGLIERDCVDEKTFETTKCYDIITKKRIKTEDLEDVVKILKSKKAKHISVSVAKSEKDILEEKLPI